MALWVLQAASAGQEGLRFEREEHAVEDSSREDVRGEIMGKDKEYKRLAPSEVKLKDRPCPSDDPVAGIHANRAGFGKVCLILQLYVRVGFLLHLCMLSARTMTLIACCYLGFHSTWRDEATPGAASIVTHVGVFLLADIQMRQGPQPQALLDRAERQRRRHCCVTGGACQPLPVHLVSGDHVAAWSGQPVGSEALPRGASHLQGLPGAGRSSCGAHRLGDVSGEHDGGRRDADQLPRLHAVGKQR